MILFCACLSRINRNIVECKALKEYIGITDTEVLIETSWNVKIVIAVVSSL